MSHYEISLHLFPTNRSRSVIEFQFVEMGDLFKYGFKRIETASAPSESSANSSAKETDKESNELDSESESDVGANFQPAKRKKINTIRKYDTEYLAYGFICAGTKELPLPQCLLCHKILSNGSMKPSHLIRHLRTTHAADKDKPIEFFQRKRDEKNVQSKSIDEFSRSDLKSINASFVAAYNIVQQKKPFTIGEQLLKPVLKEITKIMFGEAAMAKVDSIALSNSTVSRRVSEMANDVQQQLSLQLKEAGDFCLQFDESVDVAGEAILVGFVRYVTGAKIVEDIFCCCSLPQRTTAEAMFFAIDEAMKKLELEWKNVVGMCTDGARAMIGNKTGLAKRISDVANGDFESSHCVLHREALAAKSLPEELNETLQNAVKIINNVKANPLHSRIFAKICVDMSSSHTTLLLHTEVRWLSRGRVLNRLYELRSELVQYFENYMAPILEQRRKAKPAKVGKKVEKLPEEYFLEYLKDDKWIARLAYLVDIFHLLNELNLQMQGRGANCFKFHDKIEAFENKLLQWKQDVNNKIFDAFPSTKAFLGANPAIVKYIRPIITDHLQRLINEFKEYFPAEKDPRESYLWVVNPFLNRAEKNALTTTEKNQLLGKFIWSPFRNIMIHET